MIRCRHCSGEGLNQTYVSYADEAALTQHVEFAHTINGKIVAGYDKRAQPRSKKMLAATDTPQVEIDID